MSDEIKPSFLTVAEVQKILRISRGKAYELVKTGEIPSTKIGDSIRIPRIQFEEKFGLVAA